MSACSRAGSIYESIVWNICKQLRFRDTKKRFNTQAKDELAGSSSKNDIQCDFNGDKNIGIEIKKGGTPDWMQLSIGYDTKEGRWKGKGRNKIPDASKLIIEELIANANLFNGKIPPFFIKPITHPAWVKLKKETDDFNDCYIDCPSDTIRRLYLNKGCQYIQVSGKGLYHLGDDVCGFGVPIFECPQRLRVRTKVHSKRNSKGFTSLSVTVACQPKKIKELDESPFSLDNEEKLPDNLEHPEPISYADGL